MGGTALVLGATGGIGGAVARALLEDGWAVRALARDGEAAEARWTGSPHGRLVWTTGDALHGEDVARAAEGAAFIVHAVNPPGYRNWDRVVLPMIDNSIAAARRAGGARIVLPGTIYNFDPARCPIVGSDTPQTPLTRKGRIRVALEDRLSQAAREGVPSLIVRAGDFFGPGAPQSWFAQVLARDPLKRIVVPGGPGIGHSWAYLPDLARSVAGLMGRADRLAAFERVQFAGYWDPDGTALPSAVRRVIGRPDLPIRRFPWWLIRMLAPFGGFPRELAEIEPYWRHPQRLDNARLLALLGDEPRTPLDAALRATFALA
ncbi:epimerase [Methylobacterium gregans]|uniref:NAD(P)-binding domain-containing protein n=2 Tax=Methylobacterium gregans TaxID=374424 RepID=A0AA37MAU2_9HYPH|nr:hypothetical protein NBEOAGPD_2453 [Methylobacterium gregans]GLS56585.1 epimerase [Methylobacterium gregans]